MPTDFAIETDGLGKIYRSGFAGREVRAVTDLTLRVPIGARYGLLGPNGAGKTTFVKMLLSAVHPSAGSARIFGRDARLPESRRLVGYLPENHRFPTYLTGAGMLHFYGSLSGVHGEERRKRIHNLLKLVGLAQWGRARIRKYSKGMLQRLGLAQALVHHPKLLILDEPTDGLDPAGRREIHDILYRLNEKGATIFINSHRLQEVESFCDHVGIMREGTLTLAGKMSDLLTGKGFTITAPPLPSQLVDEIHSTGASARQTSNGLTIKSTSSDQAHQVIDKIRASGYAIESFAPATSSLEDLFHQATAERGR